MIKPLNFDLYKDSYCPYCSARHLAYSHITIKDIKDRPIRRKEAIVCLSCKAIPYKAEINLPTYT